MVGGEGGALRDWTMPRLRSWMVRAGASLPTAIPSPPPCAAGKKGRLVLAEKEGERGGGGPLGEGATERRERECAEGERGKESRAAASTVCTVYREGRRGKGPEGLDPSSDEKERREGS